MARKIVHIPVYSANDNNSSQGDYVMGVIFDNWKGEDKIYQIGNGAYYKPIVDDNEVFQYLKQVEL